MRNRLEAAIRAGIRYLETSHNPDGGLPAVAPGDASGCWTTAEGLEAIMLSHAAGFDRRPIASEFIRFLESSQFGHGHPDAGGWPVVAGAGVASTMATGHALAALAAASAYFVDDPALAPRARKLMPGAIEWLCRVQGRDKGWRVEPSAEGEDGSRMIAVVYALRGLLRAQEHPAAGAAARHGIEWIQSMHSAGSGFAAMAGAEPDACSTARALAVLLQSGELLPTSDQAQQALAFIIRHRAKGGFWELDSETYVTVGAPGQTVFNSNTPLDVLIALVRSGSHRDAQVALARWCRDGQEPDGSWVLASHTKRIDALRTWPTNEAILALEEFRQSIDLEDLEPAAPPPIRRVALAALAGICVVQAVLLADGPGRASAIWDDVSPGWKAVLLSGVLLALAVNLVASGIYDLAKKRLRRGGD